MRKPSVRKTLVGASLALAITFSLNTGVDAAQPVDKRLHFNAGLVLSTIFYSTHTYNPDIEPQGLTPEEYRWERRKEALAWGLGAALAAGTAKELLDSLGTGTVEWKDLESTLLGGLAASVGSLLLDYLISGISDLTVKPHPQGLRIEYPI